MTQVVAHNPVIQTVNHALAAFNAADDAIQARGRITEADIWRLCDRRDVLQQRVSAARASGLIGADEMRRIEGVAAETLQRIEGRVAQRTNAEIAALSRIMPNPRTQAFYQALIAFNGADEAIQAKGQTSGQITEADIWTLRHRRDDMQERLREARDAGVDAGILERMAAMMNETRERIERRSAQMRNAQIVALPPGATAPQPAIMKLPQHITNLFAACLPPEERMTCRRNTLADMTVLDLSGEMYTNRLQCSDAVLRDFFPLRGLTELNLYNVQNWVKDQPACTCPVLARLIRNNTNLKKVNLHWFGLDGAVLRALSQCSGLDDLDISGRNGWNGYSKEDLASLLKGCPNLRMINLGWFFNLDGDHLDILAEHGKNLEGVDLNNTGNIREVDIERLTSGCRKIRHLNLYAISTWGFAGPGIPAILAKNCPELRSLRMTACRSLDDAGIGQLARGCPHLQMLELSGCYCLTDAVLKDLRRYSPELECLDVSDNSNITLEGVREILGCPNLRELRFDWGGRHAISYAEVEALRKEFPGVAINDLSHLFGQHPRKKTS